MSDLASLSDEALLARIVGLKGQLAPTPTASPTVEPSMLPDDALLSRIQELKGELASSPTTSKPKPLTPGETLLGGFQKILSGMTFNYGDEITAGGNALIDAATGNASYSDAYDQRLAATRDIDKRYSQEHPYASLAYTLSGAKIPLPSKLFSSTKGLAPAVKNIAKGAGLGGLFGLASGSGEGEGATDRAAKAVQSAKSGATLGGVFSGLAEGAQGAYGLFRGIFPKVAETADEIARNTAGEFTNLSELPAKIAKAETTPFSQYQTVGEQINDPGLGLLSKINETRLPIANETKLALDLARNQARQKLFTSEQGVPVTNELAGKTIQGALSNAKSVANDKVKAAYDLAKTAEGVIPIDSAKKQIVNAVARQAKESVPIDGASRKIISDFAKLPDNLTVEQLQAQRQIVGDLLGDLKTMSNPSPRQKAGLRVLSKLFGQIDDAETSAIANIERQGAVQQAQAQAKAASPQIEDKLGNLVNRLAGKAPAEEAATILPQALTQEEQQLIKQARELAAEKGATFKEGAVGDILQPGRYGKLETQASDVFPKAISGPEEARQVMKALREKTIAGARVEGAKQAEKTLATNLMEHLRERSTNPLTQEFNAASYARNWRKMRPVAKEALNPKQIKAIESVRADLTAEARFNSQVGNAAKGQSITSTNTGTAGFVKENIGRAISSKIGIVGRFFNSITEGRTKQIEAEVDRILVKLSFDKNFASEFASAPTKKAVSKITEQVLQELATKAAFTKNQMNMVFQDIKKIPIKIDENPKKDTQKILWNSNMNEKKNEKDVRKTIESDPLDAAIFEIESGSGKYLTNKQSTAKGGFQIIDSTAKSLGLKDPFDLEQNYNAYLKLKEDHKEMFKTDDPYMIYAAHFLGATRLRKWLEDKPLSGLDKEKIQEWETKVRPRFAEIYAKKQKQNQEIA